jgi:hypothetical protein
MRLPAFLIALVLAGAVPAANAASVEPLEGAYKGRTAQKLPVYFGVKEGAVVNVRYTVRWGFCGRFTRHNVRAVTPIAANGHFSLAEPQSSIEGDFVEPGVVKGTAIFIEHPLAGCPYRAVPFTAHLR